MHPPIVAETATVGGQREEPTVIVSVIGRVREARIRRDIKKEALQPGSALPLLYRPSYFFLSLSDIRYRSLLGPVCLPIPPLRHTEKSKGKFREILPGRHAPWQGFRISRKCRINRQERPRGRQLEPPSWRTSLCIKDYTSVADLDWHRLLEHPILGRAMLVDVFLVRQKATLYPRARQWQRLVASDAAWLSCCGLLLI